MNNNKAMQTLKSRKFWAALVGLGVAFFGERAGVDTTQLTAAVVTVVGYILGTALEDGLSSKGD